ncbi:uncharacterized protein LOC113870081 [Abrus precatorius]|uniref:Uncharacterized protein LOC113870081 n=1 Tax=Abrus precatorius TaxID=3816 RepID=A0A8B8M1E9_ABRPR|nr:uncharacterized protein LOC113870081 [Abrus precatorius]
MNPSAQLSFFFTVSLIFISALASPSASAPGTELYQSVCKDAGENANRCLKFLGGYPKITGAKDYLSLCKSLLEVAIKRATEGQNYFVAAAKKKPSSAALKQCSTFFYDGLVRSFESASGELVESPDTANYDCKVAGDGPVNCNSALMDEKINDPALSNLNDQMSFLSYVAFLATNHLPQDP